MQYKCFLRLINVFGQINKQLKSVFIKLYSMFGTILRNIEYIK